MLHVSGCSHPRGFTLLEVAIATMILAIVVLVVFTFTLQIQRTEERERARTEATREARSTLDTIADDLSRATGDSLDLSAPDSGLPRLGRAGQFETQDLYFETVVFDDDPANMREWPGPQYQYRWRAENGEWRIERTITERDSNGDGDVDTFEDINNDGVLGTIVTVLAREAYNEDFLGNGDGVWGAADDDQNNDNLPQRGLWFEVRQEDLNNDGKLNAEFEDLNHNGRNDATVTVTIDITRRFRDTEQILGLVTLSTTVQVQNALPTN